MASTITDKKFGVVHTSPSKLVANAASLEEGKLYFASGDANGVVKQGIYGIVGVTTEGHIDEYNVAMFGTGAVADGTGYGLSQYNFDGDASVKLKNLHDTSANYLLKTDYVQVDEDSSGWVPMADALAGTIDSSTSDWVLAFDGTKVDWFKLPENAFKNDNSIYSGVTPISVTNGQISHANSGITAGTYGDSGTPRALNFGEAFKVVDVNVNAFGHVTDISVKELTLPAKPSTAGTADKVAKPLTIKGGGTEVKSFDGESAVIIDIKSGDSSTLTITGTTDGSIKITPVTGAVSVGSAALTTGDQVATYVSDILGNLSGALVYKGTITSYANLPSNASAGWVYIASEKFETTAAQTKVAYAIEIGDMFIYNGTEWNIVSSEFDVSVNNNQLPDWGKETTIATVDGVELKVKLPANPNTDEKVSTTSSTAQLFLIGKTDGNKGISSAAHYNASVYIDGGYLYSGGNKVLTSETYTGTVKWVFPGTGLANGSADSSITSTGTLNLKTAATNEIGGIKVGSVQTSASSANTTINANKFAVHVDSNGLGFVAIPAYNNYSHPALQTTSTAVDASALTAITLNSSTSFTVVNGVYRDASGHVGKVSTTTYTVPASAFTDTKNTAGSSNKAATKLLLVGATSTTTGETFTNANVYINTANQIVAASGVVAANNPALVNGGTVYTAIEDAKNAAIAGAAIYWETL